MQLPISTELNVLALAARWVASKECFAMGSVIGAMEDAARVGEPAEEATFYHWWSVCPGWGARARHRYCM